jgi:hypothetical protein
LWIVPAKVEGTWKFADGEFVLKQSYQMITGSLEAGGRTAPLVGARLRGDEIYIRTADNEYRGRVSGDTIVGTSKSGGEWKATRVRR